MNLQDKQRIEAVTNDAVRRIPKKRPLPNDESDNETGRSPRRRYDTSFPSFTMEDMLNKTKSESLDEILRRKPSPKSKLVRSSLMEKSLEELEDYDPLAEKRARAVDMQVKERAARVHSRAASTLFDGEEEAAPQFSAKNRKKRILLDDSDDEEEAFNVKPTNGKSSHGNGSKSKINLEDEGDDQFVIELIDTPITKHKSNKSKVVDTQPAESSKRRKDDRTVFNLVDESELQDALDEDAVGANSDEEDGHGWDEDMTSAQIVAKAHAVIRQCEAVSKNLRKSLLAWQQPSTAASNPAQSSKVKGDVVDCVNLVSIASPEANKHHSVTATITNQALLNNEDIAVFCPGLLLNPYQLVGVNWLKLLYENEVNGVLADDMGLGKTVQSIAFMGWLSVVAQNTPRVRKPHLIVVPASVLSNWENELERFCPSLTVLRYHGSQNEKSLLRQELRRRIPLGEIDVILTTYTLFERESNAKDRAFFMNQKFNFLILDEAHSIKNASSSRYNNLNALNTKHRLLLSGTPVQNDLRELLALLSFLMPRVFDRENCEAMVMAFDWDINGKNQESNKVVAGVSLSQLKAMLAPFVLRRLKRDVLDHLSDKTTEVVLLPPAPAQKSVYEETIFSYAQRKERSAVRAQEAEVEARLSEGKLPSNRKRSANSGKDTSTEKVEKDNSGGTSANAMPSIEKWLQTPSRQSNILDGNGAIIDLLSPEIDQDLTITDPAEDHVQPLTTAHSLQNTALAQELRNLSSTDAKHLFTALRKVANHPLLLRIHYQDEELFEKISRVVYNEGYFGFQVDYARAKAELETFSDFDIHQLCLQYEYQLGKYALDSTALYDSPKMDHLRTLLPRLQDEGHRMLIFSQWTRLLDLLEVLLQDMGMDFLRLDGSTPIKERQERIDLFNADTSISVFLLSTKAGGLGINLTSADTVILHDLDFNPENDKQAEDRCHRIGQTKPVTVYKLVTQRTVDEDIYEMGERKRQLSQAVLSDNSKGKVVDVDDDEEATNGKTGKKKGGAKKKGKGDDDDGGGEEDLDAISRILSRALLRQGIQL